MKKRLLIAALLVLFGCHVKSGVVDPATSSDDIDLPAPNAQYLAADFKADFVDTLCDWYTRCVSSVGDIFGSKSSCVDVFDFAFARNINETNSFVDPLLYKVDADLAASCLAKVTSTACNATAPVFENVDGCVGVFVGRLNAGECCDRRDGCAPGLVCERSTAAGVCSALGAPGDTCNDQECAAPALCETVRNGNTTERQCVVPLGLGAGEDCENSFDCVSSLSCQQVDFTDRRKCLLRPDVGDACSQTVPCADGLHCVGEPGFAPLCAATGGAIGKTCIAAKDCAADLLCTPGNTSQTVCLPPRLTGDPCSENVGETCSGDLGCMNGVCGVLPVPQALGDPCYPDGPSCPDPLGLIRCVDNGAGFVCAAPAREGEPCEGDSACDLLRGLFCNPDTAICVALPKVGEACPLRICQPIFTVACIGEGNAALCAPRRQLGEACSADHDESIFSECSLDTFCGATEPGGPTTCRAFNEGAGECK